MREWNGKFTTFANPSSSARDIAAISINARGDVTGWFFDANKGGPVHGYVRDRNGNFTVLDAPNAGGTYAESINARGDVAGWFYYSSSGEIQHGFVVSAH